MVGLRSFGIILGDFSHTLFVLNANVWDVEINIRIHKTVQLLARLGGRVVILEFTDIEAGTSTVFTYISPRDPAGTRFLHWKEHCLASIGAEVIQTVKHLTPIS